MPRKTDKRTLLLGIYRLLDAHFGDLGWWPARSPFEVIAGAILTQNTSWTGAEKAVNGLKQKDFLDPFRIAAAGSGVLQKAIRPAGYFRAKSRTLKGMSAFLIKECGGNIGRLKKIPMPVLREKLLAVKGIGPETADSILMYALGKSVFVVDAYTKRIFSRHGLIGGAASYDAVQKIVHDNFSADTGDLGQFHALLVETAKNFCKKKKGECGRCPLRKLKK